MKNKCLEMIDILNEAVQKLHGLNLFDWKENEMERSDGTLKRAKIDAIENEKRIESKYDDALEAIKNYRHLTCETCRYKEFDENDQEWWCIHKYSDKGCSKIYISEDTCCWHLTEEEWVNT